MAIQKGKSRKALFNTFSKPLSKNRNLNEGKFDLDERHFSRMRKQTFVCLEVHAYTYICTS